MILEGEVTLTRTLLDHEIWQAGEPYDRRSAFVHLLLVANNRPGLPILRGKVREMKVGQVGHSIAGLADQWKWSQGKVRRFLEWLAERGTIEFKTEMGGDVFIRFVNYDLWNGQRRGDGEAAERSRRGGGEAAETEGEREGEKERETPPPSAENSVPSKEQIFEVVSKYGWTLDDCEDWRLVKMNDPKHGFHRMLNWQADVLLYARRLDGPPPRRPIGFGAGISSEKNGGWVSATTLAIRADKERAAVQARVVELREAIQQEEGWSEEKLANKRELEGLERQLAALPVAR